LLLEQQGPDETVELLLLGHLTLRSLLKQPAQPLAGEPVADHWDLNQALLMSAPVSHLLE